MKFKIFFSIFVLLCLCSCKITSIYYNDTSQIDDGDIFGCCTKLFFVTDQHITTTRIKSQYLIKELASIKEIINKKGQEFYKDDNFYNYAFITNNRDTIFSNELIVWRYKNKTFFYETKMKIIDLNDKVIRIHKNAKIK
jgi:hypothetical protein